MCIEIFKIIVLVILLSASIGCNAEEVKADKTNTRVVFIGYYSNEVLYDSTGDPHVDGYSLELYRQGSTYFGRFFSASGMTGDTPNGRLDNIKFNPQNGDLSFSAKLTTGTISDRNRHSVPANDLFEFAGKFSKKNVSGLLTTRSAYTLSKIDSSEKITLKRIGNYDYSLPDSYESWLKQPLNNGPQW